MNEELLHERQKHWEFWCTAKDLSLDDIEEILFDALGEVKAYELAHRMSERVKYIAVISLTKKS